MSDTPETDEIAEGVDQSNFEYSWRDDFEEFAWVPAEFARKLERERDEARELVYAWESRWKAEVEFAAKVSVKRDEVKDILRKLLEIIPEPECHDFAHTKEERHAFLEKCPVMARYDALIAQAKEAAK